MFEYNKGTVALWHLGNLVLCGILSINFHSTKIAFEVYAKCVQEHYFTNTGKFGKEFFFAKICMRDLKADFFEREKHFCGSCFRIPDYLFWVESDVFQNILSVIRGYK